jgi:hypothetical protein
LWGALQGSNLEPAEGHQLPETGGRDLPIDPETELSPSPMHISVYRRFEAGQVLLYDRLSAYRPGNMRVHVDFRHYFDQTEPEAPQCVADDIESKWRNDRYPAGCGRGTIRWELPKARPIASIYATGYRANILFGGFRS